MQPDVSTIPGRGPLVVTCSECPAQFRTFPSQGKASCSRKCYGVRQTRLAQGRNALECAACGITFYPAPYDVRVQNRQACSRVCRGIIRSRTQRQDPVVRFWRMVTKTDSCWPSGKGPGYGNFRFDGQQMAPSRYAWILATGDTLTSDDVVGHVCDNPPCVRHDDEGTYDVDGTIYRRFGHLWLGDNAANMRDMAIKGRANRDVKTALPGEANPNAKLTETAVRLIRLLGSQGVPESVLAEQNGVTPQMIHLILTRKNWTHID